MKRETSLFISWYTLPLAQNLKPTFEFQTPLAQNSPASTSELITFGANLHLCRNCKLRRNFPLAPRNYFLLAPTRISLGIGNPQRFLLGDSSLILLAPRN